MSENSHIIRFKKEVNSISMPSSFTYPFYYDPHPISIIAAEQLQEYLIQQHDQFQHNFGLDLSQKGLVIGKMFGILVVKDSHGELGFLAAFSGKLGGSNHHSFFVPPVFDMLTDKGFYKHEEIHINELTEAIFDISESNNYKRLKTELLRTKALATNELSDFKGKMTESKRLRKVQRMNLGSLKDEQQRKIENGKLNQESIEQKRVYKDLKLNWENKINNLQSQLEVLDNKIEELKILRAQKSALLQEKLFDNYTFYNIKKEEKSLLSIFKSTFFKQPPSGAGECAAPKLLQYAFKFNLQPIAMAEFWWGASPASEVRKHKQYYPACRGKCEPILGHMLQHMQTDPNPMLNNPAEGRDFEIVYEDHDLIVVNKPAEFLSVPGININDSVLSRLQQLYKDTLVPLLVHRLDMSTSGLLIAAKHKEAHHFLQRQFINRKVEKRYEALLEGKLLSESGVIELPLRLDIENRPFQIVCYQHGKYAKTLYEKVSESAGCTKVNFYPQTGRTHQLRVHAAHIKGLNLPIVGDDLYGNKGERLFLHAAELTFLHPSTRKKVNFLAESKF